MSGCLRLDTVTQMGSDGVRETTESSNGSWVAITLYSPGKLTEKSALIHEINASPLVVLKFHQLKKKT